ncbi:hypothetical protein V8G54_015073 [Vigna mungo]|uniref:Uncharacterized protein n=1 Tax=Vigna mungo TaxID=3915 RepID=A0AAQ3NKI4_VIGMU
MAGRTVQCLYGALFSTRHELAAPISGIPSHGRCMVLQAFSVPHHFLVPMILLMHSGCAVRRRRGGDNVVVVVVWRVMVNHETMTVSITVSPTIRSAVYWDWDFSFLTRKFHSLLATCLLL